MSEGKPPLKISPIRAGGATEILEIGRIVLNVGADSPFSILFAADTHLNFWDVSDFRGNPDKEAFFGRRWVRFPQALNALYATIDLAAARGLPLIYAGDLLDWNTRANLEVAVRAMRGVNWLFAMGNHEYHSSQGASPPLSPDEARAAVARFSPNQVGVTSRTMYGVNFILFDNGETNLRPETIAGVERELARGLPSILVCHAPPTYTPLFLENSVAMRKQILLGQGYAEEEIDRLPPPKPVEPFYDASTLAFYDRLRGCGAVKAILCGHTHVGERDQFSDTADMIVAGGNYEGHVLEITFA